MDRIIFASASALARGIRERHFSATEVLEALIAHIDRHNPRLNAFATLNGEQARKRAQEADAALARGELWGPLHGVPITIKDTLETAGCLTTSGNPDLSAYIPEQDATAVARLRRAGGILLGKTNPAAMAGDYQSTNPLFGRVNNPWNLACTSGGSSGGSAAAIASGMSPLDLGSDIAGSIRQPAHYCGVFGLKPTDRRVPTTGHIPELPGLPKGIRRMLCLGPLARSVEDLRLSLSLIAGADGRQPEIPPVPLDAANARELSSCRIAWTDAFAGVRADADTRRAMQALIGRLAELGCRVEQTGPPGFDYETAWETYGAVLAFEAYASVPFSREFLKGIQLQLRFEFYERTQTKYRSGTPIIRGGRIFPPGIPQYMAALTRRDGFVARIDQFMNDWDAWVCPTTMTPAFSHRSQGQPIAVDSVKQPYMMACGAFTTLFSLTGHPVVVLPVALSDAGLPIGIQLVGKRWRDMELLNLAEGLTSVIDWRGIPPGCTKDA